MTRIIYKKGLEGQNKIGCIEGIEIEMMNGQYALIYPKYAKLPFADEKNINEYKKIKVREIDALKACNMPSSQDIATTAKMSGKYEGFKAVAEWMFKKMSEFGKNDYVDWED